VAGICDAGYYCSSGANTSTPTDSVTGDICPAGFYCPSGSNAPIPCPDGMIVVAILNLKYFFLLLLLL